ncbi:hypothetical protein [Vibrio owensii]|uniref:hypothetical protein n=1 Tax=Vibrio owensii TaxID=696485 RepID=UPI003AAFC959
MKKSVIALLTAATLSSSAFAAVSDAQFQWGGLVPPVEVTSPEVCIENTGLVDHMNGVLEFTNDGKEINLVDASDLSFKVMNNACGKDETITEAPVDIAYQYTLQQTAISFGGLTETNTASELHGWLHVTANNTALVQGTKSATVDAGVSTVLTVAQKGALTAEKDVFTDLDGQDVLVLAVLEVNDVAI